MHQNYLFNRAILISAKWMLAKLQRRLISKLFVCQTSAYYTNSSLANSLSLFLLLANFPPSRIIYNHLYLKRKMPRKPTLNIYEKFHMVYT